MASRERFHAAVSHTQPDRAPIDLACTSLTGMMPGVQAQLRDLLGFTGDGSKANNGVDERLLEWAGCDFRGVGGIVSLEGTLTRTISPTEFIDCWGVRRRLIGSYWEIVESPLADASIDDIETFPWPDPELDDGLLERLHEDAQTLARETPYVVIGEHPVFGVLELGCWMCGYSSFLTRMAMDTGFVRAFFDRYFAIQMRVVEQYYGAIGEYVGIAMSGDDFGMQLGPLVSPAMFEALVAPYFSERIARTKALGPRYYWHHSCGSVVGLLDEIIGCGVDILNPIQTSAHGMTPRGLKEAYGERLTFWGAIDVQDLLRTATPDDVAACVHETISVLGRNGGYVLAPAHNVQNDVPVENIAAMIEAARGVTCA
ncbi:MAG TPA: uroporphyrinogen decarboxylase family protein [Candidatus Hydrogenedentes bacterium]|nr:uroporphyrinogen decarboxylase family protein [Candidatus Hydrogenedentota bacterium]HPG69266.1 uroporphyrinogen decarboxylase family protein [Candidatus Hydrogenedentota bacterium]